MIRNEIQRKRQEQMHDMKAQRLVNEQNILEEKDSEKKHKQERRKIIQENLLQSQEIIDKYWVSKLNKCSELKQSIYQAD